MSLVSTLVDRYREPTRIYECRHCGTTLGGVDDECDACEETSVAVYDL